MGYLKLEFFIEFPIWLQLPLSCLYVPFLVRQQTDSSQSEHRVNIHVISLGLFSIFSGLTWLRTLSPNQVKQNMLRISCLPSAAWQRPLHGCCRDRLRTTGGPCDLEGTVASAYSSQSFYTEPGPTQRDRLQEQTICINVKVKVWHEYVIERFSYQTWYTDVYCSVSFTDQMSVRLRARLTSTMDRVDCWRPFSHRWFSASYILITHRWFCQNRRRYLSRRNGKRWSRLPWWWRERRSCLPRRCGKCRSCLPRRYIKRNLSARLRGDACAVPVSLLSLR